jgi:hypothetical protein
MVGRMLICYPIFLLPDVYTSSPSYSTKQWKIFLSHKDPKGEKTLNRELQVASGCWEQLPVHGEPGNVGLSPTTSWNGILPIIWIRKK